MLTGLVQNLRLRAEARTGLSSAVVVFALIAAVAVVAAFVFFVFAASSGWPNATAR
jgi:nitrate reductase NapE component